MAETSLPFRHARATGVDGAGVDGAGVDGAGVDGVDETGPTSGEVGTARRPEPD